jgi:hypothetical protein
MIITSAVDMSSHAVSPVFIHPSRQHPDTRSERVWSQRYGEVTVAVGPAAGPTTSRFGDDHGQSSPQRCDPVTDQLLPFIGVAIAVVVIPDPDMALVARNVFRHG